MKLMLGDNNVTIEERDAATGKLLRRQHRHNHCVETGRFAFRDLLLGVRSAPNYIAVGISDSGIFDFNTTLSMERARVECHSRKSQPDRAIYFSMFGPEVANDPNYPILEVGLFATTGWLENNDPHDGGVLMCRVLIGPVLKSSKITLGVVWEIPLFAE